MLYVALIFIILGIAVKYGKMYHLMAGYNTLPEKERRKYNAKGLAAILANTLFSMAVIIVGGVLAGSWLNNPEIERYTFYPTLAVGISYLLIKSNSGKLKRSENNHKP